MSLEIKKPIIGFSCGDLNGIGIEIIIKSLSNPEIFEHFIPVVFANSKSLNFYRKTLPEVNISYNNIKDFLKLSHKQINVFTCWEEDVLITPGVLNETGGKYALLSLEASTLALKSKEIDALVTAPIHKKNIQSSTFNFSGHTPYLQHNFNTKDVLMFMVAQNMRVGIVTEHVSIANVASNITKDAIISKLQIMNQSLKEDFGIEKPKIAILGLNPHASDDGLIGNEEDTIIKPAIKEVKNKILAFGPYSADAFFARNNHEKFDGVLAMYHDQGLIPFKSLAIGEGVNYTAGLQAIRTSPDHGTAFDIAGKGIADPASFMEAIYTAIDIVKTKFDYFDNRKNPIRKISAKMFANAKDE